MTKHVMKASKALKEMQEFLQSIDPALSNYAHALVRDLLTPELLKHLPWAEFRGYGIPNGHISLIRKHFLLSTTTVFHQNSEEL